MTLISIILLSIGLAMDAFAVSIASGVAIHRMHVKHALRVGLFFGGFQALMPVLGWICGSQAAGFMQSFDHWIAFGLLSFLGAKMIYESFMLKEEEKHDGTLTLRTLFALAVATSIDAFAVGLTLSLLNISIIRPALFIGGITFVFSFAGTYIGDHIGHLFENKIEIAGGLILIGIGLKILLQHLL